jgi:hypothetical protein
MLSVCRRTLVPLIVAAATTLGLAKGHAPAAPGGTATPKGLDHAEWKDHNDGHVGLPSGRGLGVQVDEKELERLSKLPSEWKWPVYGRLKDGSIADS